MALKRAIFATNSRARILLQRRNPCFRHCTFTFCVVGDLTRSIGYRVSRVWKERTHGGLDFSGGDGGLLVVLGQSVRLASNSLEEVSHERIYDRHGLRGNTCIRVHLLQYFIDVDPERLLSGPS